MLPPSPALISLVTATTTAIAWRQMLMWRGKEEEYEEEYEDEDVER
jgi:hypothetical protein